MHPHLSKNRKWLAINAAAWSLNKVLFLAFKLWGIESPAFQAVHLPLWQWFLAPAISGALDGISFAVAGK